MKIKWWGALLLGAWLIATGILQLLNVGFPGSGSVLAVLAIAAGVAILLEGRPFRLRADLGTLLVSIWLILQGVLPLFSIDFAASGTVLAVLATAAGLLLLLRR